MLSYWPTHALPPELPGARLAFRRSNYLASTRTLQTLSREVNKQHAVSVGVIAGTYGIPEWLLAGWNKKPAKGGVFRAGEAYEIPVSGFFRNPETGETVTL